MAALPVPRELDASLRRRWTLTSRSRATRPRLADLLALVRRRASEVVEGFYDIGEALREILDHKLYAAAGSKSLEALVESDVRIVVARSVAERATRNR